MPESECKTNQPKPMQRYIHLYELAPSGAVRRTTWQRKEYIGFYPYAICRYYLDAECTTPATPTNI